MNINHHFNKKKKLAFFKTSILKYFKLTFSKHKKLQTRLIGKICKMLFAQKHFKYTPIKQLLNKNTFYIKK